jgi:hypothetical protein
VLADASLAQAKRALSAVHVAVLLLDAPRLLTVGQVRLAETLSSPWLQQVNSILRTSAQQHAHVLCQALLAL